MSVGEKLRSERIRLGLDLDSVARETRISRRYLEAIESDQPGNCPGSFFYRSFVRQYAARVGLDPSEIEAEIDAVQPPVISMPEPARTFPLKTPDPIVTASNRIQFGANTRVWGSVVALLAVMVGCSVMYAWWRQRQIPTVEQPAAEVMTPGPQPSRPATVPVAQQQQVPPETHAGPAPAAQTPAVRVGNQPEATPAAVAPPSPEEPVMVAVSCRERAWVSLITDGKQTYVGVLKPGETKTVGSEERTRMRVGNAGGIDVTYNGKSIGPVGPRGQIRTVVFTRKGYHIVTPEQEEDGEEP